eukprot:UN18449
MMSTSLNIVNTIIGAGMLSLPYAFSETGVSMGIVWFLIAAAGEAQAVHLLACCVLKERKFSFRALAIKTLPFERKTSEKFMEGLMAVNCFGLATSYLVVIGDLAPDR